MARDVDLRRVGTVLSELSYPVLRPDAAAELADVTVQFPDGEQNLGELVSETRDDSYDSAAELATELRETSPVEGLPDPPSGDEASDGASPDGTGNVGSDAG